MNNLSERNAPPLSITQQVDFDGVSSNTEKLLS